MDLTKTKYETTTQPLVVKQMKGSNIMNNISKKGLGTVLANTDKQKMQLMELPKYRQNLRVSPEYVYSYMTAVAVINHGNKTITTDKFYSKTTSKHINYVADLYNYKVVKQKTFTVTRETYSTIEIKADSLEQAEDMLADIDGDDDNWEYYKEEIFVEESK